MIMDPCTFPLFDGMGDQAIEAVLPTFGLLWLEDHGGACDGVESVRQVALAMQTDKCKEACRSRGVASTLPEHESVRSIWQVCSN